MTSSGVAMPLLWLGSALLCAGRAPAHLRRMSTLAEGGRLRPAEPIRARVRVSVAARRSAALAASIAAVCAGALGVAALALTLGCGVLVRDRVRRRTAERARRDSAEAGALMAAELEAGTSLSAALRTAAQVDPAHAHSLAAAADAVGSSAVAEALLACAEPVLVGVGHACRIGAVSGARLAPVLGVIARESNAREQRRRAVSAALAGPRSSCVLLALLPALGTLLGFAIGARPADFLLASSAGRVVCCVGVVLDVLGLLWVRRIVRRAEEP